MNNIFEPLTDEQIYSIPEDSRIHKDCIRCRCIMCKFWQVECNVCMLCMFQARPFYKCRDFEPFIFSYEPYKSYVVELDKLYGLE